ncbi:MAG: hypothetical protein WC683_14060 [bacterium]
MINITELKDAKIVADNEAAIADLEQQIASLRSIVGTLSGLLGMIDDIARKANLPAWPSIQTTLRECAEQYLRRELNNHDPVVRHLIILASLDPVWPTKVDGREAWKCAICHVIDARTMYGNFVPSNPVTFPHAEYCDWVKARRFLELMGVNLPTVRYHLPSQAVIIFDNRTETRGYNP